MEELPENIQLYVDREGMLRAKVDYPTKQCEDCGQMCKNRVTEYKMHIHPMLHWRHRCNICNLFEHPDTEEFCLTRIEINEYYRQKYMRKKLEDK
jgi:hypothetical protein